jgi:hypothetical protein
VIGRRQSGLAGTYHDYRRVGHGVGGHAGYEQSSLVTRVCSRCAVRAVVIASICASPGGLTAGCVPSQPDVQARMIASDDLSPPTEQQALRSLRAIGRSLLQAARPAAIETVRMTRYMRAQLAAHWRLAIASPASSVPSAALLVDTSIM